MKEEYLGFKNHIKKRIPLSENEMKTFISAFRLKKVRKRQFIIQPEFTAIYRNYVLNGALRAYVVNDEGQERTIQFAIEDSMCCVTSPLYSRKRSTSRHLSKMDGACAPASFAGCPERDQNLETDKALFSNHSQHGRQRWRTVIVSAVGRSLDWLLNRGLLWPAPLLPVSLDVSPLHPS